MRVRIELPDELSAALDEVAGKRGRSAFVRAAVQRAIEQERRWTAIESSGGVIADAGQDWDDDSSDWVRRQRRGDVRRAG
jgi:metal-responsive CopG/Arc/MetJ family transcriptional regulator